MPVIKARKKPVEIEAMQWDGHNTSEVIDWILANGPRTACWVEAVATFTYVKPQCIEIDTLEGVMEAMVGDWIIRGVEDEFYPCKPQIFDKTYDVVEDVLP